MVELNGTLIAQIVNFLILVGILTKFAYKPLMKALEDRQKKIADSIDSAERERQEAQQLKLNYQQQLSDARAEAQAIVEKAEKLAEETKEQIENPEDLEEEQEAEVEEPNQEQAPPAEAEQADPPGEKPSEENTELPF